MRVSVNSSFYKKQVYTQKKGSVHKVDITTIQHYTVLEFETGER